MAVFFFQCPIQGRLELSCPEVTCLLAARQKRKSIFFYDVYTYRDMRVEIIDIIDT